MVAALHHVDGSRHSTAEPACAAAHTHTHGLLSSSISMLCTLIWRGEGRQRRWRGGGLKSRRIGSPASSLLLMTLLLSHLLSLFFCWLKFDFHHPSPVHSTPHHRLPQPLPPPLPHFASPLCLSHPRLPSPFKVPYFRSHLRQKTRGMWGIHVSYDLFIFFILSFVHHFVYFCSCFHSLILFFI